MLPLMARVLVWAQVKPGPTIKAALLDARDVVGNEIVTQPIALVYRSPEFTRLRMYGDAHRIANAGRIEAEAGAVRVVFQNICSSPFILIWIFVDVRV